MSNPQYFTGGIIYPLSEKNKTYALVKDIDNFSNCYHHRWRWSDADENTEKKEPFWLSGLEAWMIHETETKLDLALALASGATYWRFDISPNQFEGYTIERYKRGYKLTGTDEFGRLYMPYFYNAWLLDYDKAPNVWFLRKENRDFFIKHGASFKMSLGV